MCQKQGVDETAASRPFSVLGACVEDIADRHLQRRREGQEKAGGGAASDVCACCMGGRGSACERAWEVWIIVGGVGGKYAGCVPQCGTG